MALTGKQTITFVTKKDKTEKQGKKTILTVDWTGTTEEQLKAGYLSFLVVKLQGKYRDKGIPEKAEVKASDYAPGTRGQQMTAEEAFASLTPEQRAELVKKYSTK